MHTLTLQEDTIPCINQHILHAVVSKPTEVQRKSASCETQPLSNDKEKVRVELPGLTWVSSSTVCKYDNSFLTNILI